MITLDFIMASYQAGTLANEPTGVLQQAIAKVAMYCEYQHQHPDFSAQVVPKPADLKPVWDYLEKAIAMRYGTDGMTPVSP